MLENKILAVESKKLRLLVAKEIGVETPPNASEVIGENILNSQTKGTEGTEEDEEIKDKNRE